MDLMRVTPLIDMGYNFLIGYKFIILPTIFLKWHIFNESYLYSRIAFGQLYEIDNFVVIHMTHNDTIDLDNEIRIDRCCDIDCTLYTFHNVMKIGRWSTCQLTEFMFIECI